MMQRAERLGIGVSVAGHILLFGALSLGFLATRPLILTSPPMEVDLVSEVALTSATPKPAETAPPTPATAPEIAKAEEPPPLPEPPKPKPVELTPAKPKPAPAPKPTVKPKPPKPTQAVSERSTQTKAGAKPGTRLAALSLSDDIVKGAASERNPKATPTPTPAAISAPFGPAQQRALEAAISRQLKRYWKAPPGSEDLVTTLKWRLNRDGTLASGPDLVSQDGKTPINRLQQPLHVQAAMAAVKAVGAFDLPDDYYEYWKYIESFKFDKRL